MRGALAHPFTLPTLALAVLALALLLPAPAGPLALCGVTIVLALAAGEARSVRRALLVCLLPWTFLLLLHGVLGDGERVRVAGLPFARDGLRVALVQGARLFAVFAASFTAIARFAPGRFLDAFAARRWPVRWAYLVVATLQAVPRLGARARRITEAQRARGLAAGGHPLARARALTPLALPLVLGALVEADDRAFTLELRGLGAGRERTPLAPPADPFAGRALRWLAAMAVLAAFVWRVTW